MQVPCSRMKIQAISIALECSKQAVTKPLRSEPPCAPKTALQWRKALRSQRGEPCLPDTRPVSVRHGPPQSLPARPEAALRPIAREAPG